MIFVIFLVLVASLSCNQCLLPAVKFFIAFCLLFVRLTDNLTRIPNIQWQ